MINRIVIMSCVLAILICYFKGYHLKKELHKEEIHQRATEFKYVIDIH